MAQLMPLPLTVSCFSEIQIGFTFLVSAHPGSPGQRAVKGVCVCVWLITFINNLILQTYLSKQLLMTPRKVSYSVLQRIPSVQYAYKDTPLYSNPLLLSTNSPILDCISQWDLLMHFINALGTNDMHDALFDNCLTKSIFGCKYHSDQTRNFCLQHFCELRNNTNHHFTAITQISLC